MMFNLHISQRGLTMWARRHEWPYRIVWKRCTLRDLFPRRGRAKHGKREWRNRWEARATS